MSLTTAANWIGNFVIAMVTPILLASVLQTAGTFYILSVFLAAAFVFVLFTLPETKVQKLSLCLFVCVYNGLHFRVHTGRKS